VQTGSSKRRNDCCYISFVRQKKSRDESRRVQGCKLTLLWQRIKCNLRGKNGNSNSQVSLV